MRDVHEMTAAELIAEARRRQERRAEGKPLASSSSAPQLERVCAFCRQQGYKTILPPDASSCPRCWREPLEKSEQGDVVQLYTAFGVTVSNLSQPRATKQTPGLPDLWCVHRAKGIAWWHETKRPVSGRPSPAQRTFAEDCDAAGIRYTIGGVGAARAWLVEVLGVPLEALP